MSEREPPAHRRLDPGRSRRWIELGVLAAGTLGCLWLATFVFAGTQPDSIDDAFITLTYARHLAESGELYWNLDDGPVDGFTSLLDVLVKAGGISLFPRDPIFLAWIVTLLALLAVVLGATLQAAAWHRHGPPGRRLGLPLVLGLAVASSVALGDGGAFLLETPIFVLMAGIATVLAAREQPPSPVWLAAYAGLLVALALTRPEGVGLAAALLGALTGLHGRSLEGRRWGLAWGLFGLALALYLAWRLTLFGHWAPTTYYAKTSDHRWLEIGDGLRYLGAFLRRHPWAGGASAIALAATPWLLVAGRWREAGARHRFAILAGAAWLTLAMAVWAGGDSYNGGRFLAVPTVLVLLALAFADGRTKGRLRRAPLAILGLVALAQLSPLEMNYGRQLAVAARAPLTADHFRCDRLAIDRIVEVLGGERVAQSDYQRFKYFADATHVVDLHGLNTAWIAHQPWPGPVRYGKFSHRVAVEVAAPVWFYGDRLWSRRQPLAAFPLERILTDPSIADHLGPGIASPEDAAAVSRTYLPASLPVCDRYLNFLVRRDWAGRFRAAGTAIGSTH